MAIKDNKQTTEEVVEQAPVYEVLPDRIHIEEFLFSAGIAEGMVKAGFKAYAKGRVWMRPAEWQALLDEFNAR